MARLNRFGFLSIIFLVTLLLVDCGVEIVFSLYPVYTEDNQVYIPELVGDWKMEVGDGVMKLRFEGRQDEGYLMRYQDNFIEEPVHREAIFTGHLARIGEKTYLDIHPEKGEQRVQLFSKKEYHREGEGSEALEKEPEYDIGVKAVFKKVESGTPFISAVTAGSPAFHSGLREGDRIIAVDGNSTEMITWEEFHQYADGQRGSEVTYTVTREDESAPLTFTMARDYDKYPRYDGPKREDDYSVGIRVELLDTALTVEEVHTGGPAAVAGIRVGDRIEAVNGRSVQWMEGYSYSYGTPLLVESPAGGRIEMLVVRGDEPEPLAYSLRREAPRQATESRNIPSQPLEELERLAFVPGPQPDLFMRYWLGSHVFAEVSIEKDAITLRPLNIPWLFSLFGERPDVLSHAEIWHGEMIVLTAPPGEMHEFLLEYGAGHELFPDSVKYIFTRVEPGE